MEHKFKSIYWYIKHISRAHCIKCIIRFNNDNSFIIGAAKDFKFEVLAAREAILAPRWLVSPSVSWEAHADKHQLSPVHSGMIKTHTFAASTEWKLPWSHVDYPGGGVTGQRAVGERASESLFHPAEEEGTRARRRHHGYEILTYPNINHPGSYAWQITHA